MQKITKIWKQWWKQERVDRPPYYQDIQYCVHDSCPECHGTGLKANGETCVHMIICRCRKCTPYYLCSK